MVAARLIGALLLSAPLASAGTGAPVPLTGEEYHEAMLRFAEATAEANKVEPVDTVFVPPLADEWYTVTIADVSVGYMNTAVTRSDEGPKGPTISTMEVMDVQVSRGTDTSRMAFETVFTESELDPENTTRLPEALLFTGGVQEMAYDQRFANSEVKMSAKFTASSLKLTSFNGEKEHVSDLDLPDTPWYGRLRARLAFTEQCRRGLTHIVVPTMRPELGPRVVNLSSTLMRVEKVWDGTEMVEASVWTVQISDVPVNMSEAYPTSGPLRCYRMLQMGLDMPFGYLLASLSSKEEGIKASEPDPDRVLPELVYTMFVQLDRPVPRVNEARLLKLQVRTKGARGPSTLELPSAGYQKVAKVKNNASRLHVTIDLQSPLYATKEEVESKEFTSPSAMVDSSDEVVRELAFSIDDQLRADGFVIPAEGKLPGRSQLEVAYALRDLVHTHIQDKHLGTAYASASETARTKSGDCTEHAVLLAAVLKARSIPARVCHGLVYVEQGGSAIDGSAETAGATVGADGGVAATTTGQFGWHMWSQALVNGRWLDMDATLHVPYSVGHVLVGTSSMADKEAHNNHMQMAALIGNLEMSVLDVKHDWPSLKK